jgi:hypothetical protein
MVVLYMNLSVRSFRTLSVSIRSAIGVMEYWIVGVLGRRRLGLRRDVYTE